jgi:CRP-like cAMP-binding protein
MPSPLDNQLLATLPASDLAGLSGHLRIVELRGGDTLARPGEEIRTIYFPHSGIVSFMVESKDGHVVQTSMVGRDGVIGAAQALDDKVSLNKIIVQMAGTASAIDRDPLREAVGAGNAIAKVLASYEQFFVADIQQSAMCNALHDVQERMSRWILRMMDLAGLDVQLTHDQLAEMIGVRRTSVTDAAGLLQSGGLISYKRGAIHISDVGQLRQAACECHESVRQNYARIFGISPAIST